MSRVDSNHRKRATDMLHPRRLRVSATLLVIVGTALVLPGCADYRQTTTSSIKDQPAPRVQRAAKPPNASPRPARFQPAAKTEPAIHIEDCASSDCLARLKALVEDPKRGWIGQSQPKPAEYADGIRLFAYRALRGQLSCGELAVALVEMNAAAKAFREPVESLPPDKIARLRSLVSKVEVELRAERASRCAA